MCKIEKLENICKKTADKNQADLLIIKNQTWKLPEYTTEKQLNECDTHNVTLWEAVLFFFLMKWIYLYGLRKCL